MTTLATRIDQTVEIRGQIVEVSYQPVADEAARRAAVRQAAITNREHVRALFGLPCDLALPRTILDRRETRLLRGAPTGSVTLTRTTVTRHATPAIRLLHLQKSGPATLTAIQALSEFRPFSPCTYLATTTASLAVRSEAARLGIGLYDGTHGLPARPVRQERHTAAYWHFLEQLTDSLTQRPAHAAACL